MTVGRDFLEQLKPDEKPVVPSPSPSPSREGLSFRFRKAIRRPSERNAPQDESPSPPGQNVEKEISQTLHALRNLRVCRIHFDLSNELKFAAEHRRFLALLTAACREIRDFAFSIHTVHLIFVVQFQHLRTLQFSGYSRSSPEETLKVLRSLRNLEALVLSTVPNPNRDKVVPPKQTIYFSIDESVIEGMWPLKSLTIKRGITNEPSPALSVSMIKAWKRHQDSLRHLYIWTNHSLQAEQIMELLELTSKSHITDLTLWIPGKSEVLDISEQIPSTVRRGQRAVKCDGFTQETFTHEWINRAGVA